MPRLDTPIFKALAPVAIVVLACSSAFAAEVFVSLANFAFDPQNVSINPGDTVTWVNVDGEVHSTTSGIDLDDPEWGVLWNYWFFSGPGETFSYTFDSAGTYPYFCIPHVSIGMRGTVTVLSSNAVEPTTWGNLKALYR